jgi:hypothetical protein
MAKAKKCRGNAARIKKEGLERPQSQHPFAVCTENSRANHLDSTKHKYVVTILFA